MIIQTPHILAHCPMCGLTIICGGCGNNTCNGITGKDGTCQDCDSAQELRNRDFEDPVVYAAVKAKLEDIKAWQLNQLKNIPEMVGAIGDPKWAIDQAMEIADHAFRDIMELDRALYRQASESEKT